MGAPQELQFSDSSMFAVQQVLGFRAVSEVNGEGLND